MENVEIVIGANYGDEGKGNATSAIVSCVIGEKSEKVAVARFNGGAQAGHTVVSGHYRHVFSHFGAGSFESAPTILTKFFVASPTLFLKERMELSRKSVIGPEVYVSPKCYVTTPYDMLMNQFIELNRGNDRHGSCGVGFGETIERMEQAAVVNPDFGLNVSDLRDVNLLRSRLNSIRNEYVPRRLSDLGINVHTFSAMYAFRILESDDVLEMFVEECQEFLEKVTILSEKEAFDLFDTVVFEGAQGLLLDQGNTADFPHVTRSNTGVQNVIELLTEYDKPMNNVSVNYISRPYLTRHGAGPLANESSSDPGGTFEDLTNKPNDFQGALRFAPLDVLEFFDRMNRDFRKIKNSKVKTARLHKNILFTCVDQLHDTPTKFVMNGQIVEAKNGYALIKQISELDDSFQVLTGMGEKIGYFQPIC